MALACDGHEARIAHEPGGLPGVWRRGGCGRVCPSWMPLLRWINEAQTFNRPACTSYRCGRFAKPSPQRPPMKGGVYVG